MNDADVGELRAEIARLTAELDDERRISAARLDEVAAARREVAAEFDRLTAATDRQRKQAEVQLAQLQLRHREKLAAERARLIARYEQTLGWRVERRLRRSLGPAIRPLVTPARRLLGRSGRRG